MFCRFCGAPLADPHQKFCSRCGGVLVGAPEPVKKTGGIGEFFLSLLKSFCYFIAFYGITLVVQVVYMLVICLFVPGSIFSVSGYMGLSDEYWQLFSKYFCWMTAGTYVLVFLAYVIFFAARKKKLSHEANIRSVHFASLPAAFLFGVALQVVITFAVAFLSAFSPAVAENAAATDETYEMLFNGSSLISQIVMTAVAVPVIEELVFRGLIYTRMKKAMPKAAAMLLSAVAFGAAHSFGVQFVYATLLGLVLVLLYDKYNSLWVSIMLHSGFNATNYLYQLLDMESGLMQLTLMALSLGLVLVFAAYFFISKPIYKEDKTDEAL